MTDMKDATSFHLRCVDSTSPYRRIDEAMEGFDPSTVEQLERPIMKGTLCAALFRADNLWYRARILGNAGKGELDVKFIDYGNSERVAESSLRKLPAHLLAFEPQAMPSALAYIRAPRIDRPFGPQAGKYLQRHGLNQVHDAVVVESQAGQPLRVILMEEGEEDWTNSLNAFMLSEGLTVLEKYVSESSDDLPEQVAAWAEFENEARANTRGLWQHGNANGLLDEEEDY